MNTIPDNLKVYQRAELGIDGNAGFALLGPDLQEGEAEFVEIPKFDETDDSGYNARRLGAKLSACKQALEKLRERLGIPQLAYYFGESHPYGG